MSLSVCECSACLRQSVHLTAEPSAAPQHVSVSASTPRSAVVRWRDPPLDDQNGQIVHYMVKYFPTNDRSSVREEEVEAAEGQDVIEHVVNQLQPFTTYAFVVAAATDAGRGPFSSRSSVRMPQDGELEAKGSVEKGEDVRNPDGMDCHVHAIEAESESEKYTNAHASVGSSK